MNDVDGFVALDEVQDGVIPRDLLGGGEHFQDVPRNSRRRNGATGGREIDYGNVLPRKVLHDKVVDSHKI